MTTTNPQAFTGAVTEFDLLLRQQFDSSVVLGFQKQNYLFNDMMGIAKIVNTNGGRDFRFMRQNLEDESLVAAFRAGQTITGIPFGFSDGTITINERPDAVAYEMGKEHMRLADFDFISGKAEQLAYKIQRQYHLRGLHRWVSAARSSASTRVVDGRTVTFHNGGQRVTRSGGLTTRYPVSATGAQNIRADLEELAQLFDEDDIPKEGAYVLMGPRELRVALQDDKIFDRDVNRDGRNTINERVVGVIAGFNIIQVNDMPRTSYVDSVSRYSLDCSASASTGQPAFIAVRGAAVSDKRPIGVAVAAGISGVTTPMDEKTNTILMKAEMHYGIDIMHPEVAGVVDITP